MAISHKFKKGESLFATTLNGAISTGTGETITLTSVTGLPTDTEITLTFNRVDSDGNANASSLMERITGTIVGSTLTSYTRGTDGSTEQAHADGVVIEYIFNSQDWNDLIDGILVQHTQAGAHKNITGADTNLVTGTKGTDGNTGKWNSDGDLVDGFAPSGADATLVSGTKGTDGNLVEWNTDGDAVDGPTPPTGTILGTTDTQTVTNKNIVQKVTAYTPAGAATATLDVSIGGIHAITMPGGNITIAISNEAVGKCFIVEITQDGTGSRTVTWFSTIKWTDDTAPTLTTTASKRDVFGFRVTGTDTYDGFVVGQNI